MFESNSDFDFDNEISNFTSTSALKRSYNSSDVYNSPNKKQCCNKSDVSLSEQAERLLQKLDGNKSPFTTKVVSRKFPGPAGLLQVSKDGKIMENITPTKTDTEVICSQMSVSAFQEGPWERMLTDFTLIHASDINLPDKYNIAWIKRIAKDNKLINQRAPFLAGIVENVECSKTKVFLTFSFVLKDLTGNIRGTIRVSDDDYEKFAKLLRNGVVIILKQFGVLMSESDSVHIAATSNNLVRIYTLDDVINTQTFVVSDFVQKLKELKQRHRLNIPEVAISPFKLQLSLQPTFLQPKPTSCQSLNNISNVLVNCNEKQIISDNPKRKFNFKRSNITSESSSRKLPENVSMVNSTDFSKNEIKNGIDTSRLRNADNIVESIFEGIDTDALFDDF